MNTILFVSETKDFRVAALIKQLEAQDYNVIQVGYNSEDMDFDVDFQLKVSKLHMIILYGEELVIKKRNLVFIKDKAIEENIPIFMLGELDKYETIKAVIEEHHIKQQFALPVTIKDVVEAVNGHFMKVSKVILDTKKKILVVDDSGAVLRSVKGWLENKYDVVLANSGAMAIKYLAMSHPDLVLLDYEMPICDGKQVLEMIRSEPDFYDVPVVFLTGKNDKESVMSVSGLKPEGYLLKTMEPEQIVHFIDDFFEKIEVL